MPYSMKCGVLQAQYLHLDRFAMMIPEKFWKLRECKNIKLKNTHVKKGFDYLLIKHEKYNVGGLPPDIACFLNTKRNISVAIQSLLRCKMDLN